MPNGRKSNRPEANWTDAKKIEVVTTYLVLGKAPLVEAATGVPRSTIRKWKVSEWWKELVDDIKSEDQVELDAKLKKIVDRALNEIDDRIENGDWILDSRSGKVKRVPVRMKELSVVTRDMLQRREVIQRNPTQKQSEEQQVDRLAKLAEQFFKLGQQSMKEKEIKGEVIDAVYEKREEGLQTGSPMELTARTSTETSGA